MTVNELDINNEDKLENLFSTNKENDLLITTGYLSKLLFYSFFWLAILTLFICIIDPYGISPLQITISGINTEKPGRINIDRLIKPYEVWRYQPKTIFLGTSRIHQSIDPAVLANTEFAPAYNAAVPANKLSENVANLEEYFQLDKNLKNVFIELFIYNFLIPSPETPKKTLIDFLKTTSSLFLSSDAILAAFQTITFNKFNGAYESGYIAPGGNWIRPKEFNTNDTFNQSVYISNIINAHRNIPGMYIQPGSIEALERIIVICKKHHAKLYLLITPSYPWDDYRLLSLHYWPLLEEWIRKISKYENVYSFSQYNDLLEEQPGKDMKWWNDPLHFSSNMGKLMLESLNKTKDPLVPQNLIRFVNNHTVESVLKERKKGLAAWSLKNTQFTKDFDHAKKDLRNDIKD